MAHPGLPQQASCAVRCLGAAAAFFASAATGAAQLAVAVVDVERLGGHMMIAVYDDGDAWEGDGNPVATARDSVSSSTVRVFFSDLAPGRYAVKVFHDENNNGELDANMLGIPVENYGFSSGSRFPGPSSFDDAAFELDGDMTVTISLH